MRSGVTRFLAAFFSAAQVSGHTAMRSRLPRQIEYDRQDNDRQDNDRQDPAEHEAVRQQRERDSDHDSG